MTHSAGHEGSKPPCLRDDALAVLTRLREGGHVAYFAGGCVRDELLGLTPKDYDVATDAPPDRVRKLFQNTQPVGAAFGVILVRHRKSVVEVATFRTDGKYVDGRRPEAVTFTTAEEDAKRRDFTINGLFLDPVENRVIDYVGGQEDLKNRMLRAIGNPDDRFREDYLRLLRAIRFAARFDLQIEETTARAMRNREMSLQAISPERIAEELRAMLTPPTRTRAWALLRRYKFLRPIFWQVHHRQELGAGHGTSGIFEETAPQRVIPFGLALAAASLAYLWPRAGGTDVRELCDKASVKRISHGMRRNLRISNEEINVLEGSLSGAGLMLQDEFPGMAALKRFLARPTAPLTRDLLGALSRAGFHRERIERLRSQLAELEKTDFAPAPLVTGDDLTDAGLAPGPRFKVALDHSYDAQLEGRITTRRQAIEMAIGIAKGETA